MTNIQSVNNDHSFPFHNLTNSDLETLTNDSNNYDMDRLSQLRFNPFQPNQNTALSANNTELDTTFNINKICCDYFLPKDFKIQFEN